MSNEQTVSQRKSQTERALVEAKRQLQKDSEFVRQNQRTQPGPPGSLKDGVALDHALKSLKATERKSKESVDDVEAKLVELDGEWAQNLNVWSNVEHVSDVLSAAVTQSWDALLEAAKAGDEEAVLTAADELVTARARVQVLQEVHDHLLR